MTLPTLAYPNVQWASVLEERRLKRADRISYFCTLYDLTPFSSGTLHLVMLTVLRTKTKTFSVCQTCSKKSTYYWIYRKQNAGCWRKGVPFVSPEFLFLILFPKTPIVSRFVPFGSNQPCLSIGHTTSINKIALPKLIWLLSNYIRRSDLH